jgi:hypothetical protein
MTKKKRACRELHFRPLAHLTGDRTLATPFVTIFSCVEKNAHLDTAPCLLPAIHHSSEACLDDENEPLRDPNSAAAIPCTASETASPWRRPRKRGACSGGRQRVPLACTQTPISGENNRAIPHRALGMRVAISCANLQARSMGCAVRDKIQTLFPPRVMSFRSLTTAPMSKSCWRACA